MPQRQGIMMAIGSRMVLLYPLGMRKGLFTRRSSFWGELMTVQRVGMQTRSILKNTSPGLESQSTTLGPSQQSEAASTLSDVESESNELAESIPLELHICLCRRLR